MMTEFPERMAGRTELIIVRWGKFQGVMTLVNTVSDAAPTKFWLAAHPMTPMGSLTIIIFILPLVSSSWGIGLRQSLAILIRCLALYNVPAISPFVLEMGL
jgi:hypothetical protein